MTGSFSMISIFLLIVLPLGAAEPDQHKMSGNPSTAKECAICHYSWVDTFFTERRGTELAPLQTEPVAGSSEMCFSCHDGSVLDSRRAFGADHGHRTGVPPRPGMVIPNNFPLDAKGNMQCVTCHSPHGVSSAPGGSGSTFLRVANTNSSLCMICHPSMAGNTAGENHPLGRVTNNIPRELWNKHTPRETAAHLITCETCHTPHGNRQESLLKANASDSTLCLACHADKSPVNPDGSRNFMHVVNVIPTNAIVPALLVTNGARVAKNGAITCLTCHKIHQNKTEKHLLTARIDSQSSFCFNCHTDKKGFIQTKHNLAQVFPQTRNAAGKSVSDSGPCSACHMPHNNARSMAGRNAIEGQCMGCHGLAGIASKTNLFGSNHPVGVSWPPAKQSPPGAKPVSLPLYDSSRHAGATGDITCMTCHDPHKAQPEGRQASRPMFLRKAVPSLCQECHPGQIEILNSKHDLLAGEGVRSGSANNSEPVAAPLSDPPRLLANARNIIGQSPSESGSCGVCHLMHSPNKSTWAQALPRAANPADKCRVCHQPGASAEKKMVQGHSHPIDVSLAASGLKTSLPLCVDPSQTNAPGKMSCVTCHDPHRQNSGPAAQRTAGTGAKGNFLRMPAAPSPALCADCHKNEALVMRTEHDLSHFLPESANSLGQRASDSGPCGACHAVHNAPVQSKLWARDLVQPWLSTPLVDAMCRSCHSAQSVAAGKTPAFTFHPPVTVVNQPVSQGYDRSFFPLFDPASGKVTSRGGISCSSCHNVHQWSAASPVAGSGAHVEGDSNNSFLRHRSAELPCKICHGSDAIYRYQYFHKQSAHQSQTDTLLDDLFR